MYTVAGAVTPIVGDWDGDGADSRGFFRHDGKWFLDSGPTTWFGAPGDLPVVGDWDGDDIDEIGVFRPTLGKWFLTFNFDGIPEQEFYFGDPGDIPVVGDWNENGVDTAAIVRHNQ
ncbi:MAG: hypothetical protein HKN91_17715 [Acidimicrobiia bacterium]|nr:hypothetical protein [Acidimicrobiia bacterium]